MFWIVLWLYVVGALNDLFSAVNAGADLKKTRTHIDIALWPITVPFWMIVAVIYGDEVED